MAATSSFEVLSLKAGKWQTESVTQDREEALAIAEDSLTSKYFSAVKIIEERYDESTGEAKHFVVFNKKKTPLKEKSQYTGPERRKGREWRDNPKAYRKKAMKRQKGRKKKKRKRSFMAEIVKSLIILSGILFGLIFILLMYVDSQ
tara:strand:+ start:85 stop:522 length:438 start_codon:yes stop_codon:yes gene_type:complete